MDNAALEAVIEGRAGDPFAVLGPHDGVVTTFQPGAAGVELVSPADGSVIAAMTDLGRGMFRAELAPAVGYLLRIDWQGVRQETDDPYRFPTLLGALDLHLIAEGRHRELACCLGARVMRVEGCDGVRFAVWAPNARRVSVVGDFNSWDGRRHPMRLRSGAGVWEIFIPGVQPGALYKFELLGPNWESLPLKADPLALAAEPAPGTASVVADPAPLVWNDASWLAQRSALRSANEPLSIYEVHAASWMRADRGPLSWNDLADRLVPYVSGMGFTHIEFLPIMVHPFGGSWGYQPLGQFAPTAEMGPPRDFARLVDRCHEAGIGVILDWVPAHFPNDQHGLAHFDGTALYEHSDPREGLHRDWNTLIYNLGRNEVKGFLIASALYWLEHYHVDGLRVDAVASMLYRDYSRRPGEWVPNIHGGRENLEAVAFLQELTTVVAQTCPGALLIAEESTAWPGVTAAVPSESPEMSHSLGFTFKWNMGWMHDTLRYMGELPIYRSYHHDEMTFGLVYAFSERFVLPLSHDEVVHGKGSLYTRMPGDRWQKFANLRSYLSFMWGHPGKKLLFMGGEFGQPREWNHDVSLDWHLLDDPSHRGLQRLVRDLNRLYCDNPALHEHDCDAGGFTWVVGDDRAQSVFAFLRRGSDPQSFVLVVCNFTPVVRADYRIGLPFAGSWIECLNTDATVYGGAGVGNCGAVEATDAPSHGLPASALLKLPALSTLFLKPL